MTKILIPNSLPREEGDTFALHRTGFTRVTDKDCLISELCQSDLFNLISKVGPITDLQLLRSMFTQLCTALHAMHQANLCHLDIKIDNVMVGADYSLRLADFGFVTSTLLPINKMIGTKSSMAPEILNERRSTYDGVKADIFSLGLILFILYFGRPAFS
jgi:serine/threonine protein kinase